MGRILRYNFFERKHFYKKGDNLELIIKNNEVSIQNLETETLYLIGTIDCAFGNIIAVLEEEFPEAKNSTSENYTTKYAENNISKIKNKFSDNPQTSKSTQIYGLQCSAEVLYDINCLLNDSDKWAIIKNKGEKKKGEYKLKITMRDVEIWRVHHNIKKSIMPLDRVNVDFTKGIKVDISSFKDIFYGLLYFYASNKLHLVRCEHCKRWFATESLKNKYCDRNSTVIGYTHLKCMQAVKNLNQNARRIKKRIYNYLTNYAHSDSSIDNFLNQCANYTNSAEKCSAQVLTEYISFLKNYRHKTKHKEV